VLAVHLRACSLTQTSLPGPCTYEVESSSDPYPQLNPRECGTSPRPLCSCLSCFCHRIAAISSDLPVGERFLPCFGKRNRLEASEPNIASASLDHDIHLFAREGSTPRQRPFPSAYRPGIVTFFALTAVRALSDASSIFIPHLIPQNLRDCAGSPWTRLDTQATEIIDSASLLDVFGQGWM